MRRAGVVGRIGNDGGGRLVTEALEAAGVSFRLALDESLPTGTYVELDDAIVADPGASAALELDDERENQGATLGILEAGLRVERREKRRGVGVRRERLLVGTCLGVLLAEARDGLGDRLDAVRDRHDVLLSGAPCPIAPLTTGTMTMPT